MISQQLKVFIEVAETGSFSKAAAKLYLTPAAVMKHMNTFEKRLDMALLIRSNQGIELTAAGRSIYHNGKELMAAAKKALINAREAENYERKILRVGSSFLNPSKVLTDLWMAQNGIYSRYKFNIVPYTDDTEQILTVINSLGTKIDLLVGALNSLHLQEHANYLPLGTYDLCVAIPHSHRLSNKQKLICEDLYGETLIMPQRGDNADITIFYEEIQKTYPEIKLQSIGLHYDVSTLNLCEQTNALLLTLDAWDDIHPSLITIPVDWNYKVSYGILYSKTPSKTVEEFIEAIKGIIA